MFPHVSTSSTKFHTTFQEVEDTTERLRTQTTDCKEARRQRDIALRDFEDVNTALIEERSSLAQSESSLKEKESMCRQLQEKYDVIKVSLVLTHAIAKSARLSIHCLFFRGSCAQRSRIAATWKPVSLQRKRSSRRSASQSHSSRPSWHPVAEEEQARAMKLAASTRS